MRGQVRPVIISRAPEVFPHTTTIFNACIEFRHSGVRSGLCSSPGLLRSSHTPQRSPMPVLYLRQRNLASISIENGNSPGVALGDSAHFTSTSVIETISGHPTGNPYQRLWCTRPLHGSQTYFLGPLVAPPHWPSVASLFSVEPLVARKLLQPGIDPGSTA